MRRSRSALLGVLGAAATVAVAGLVAPTSGAFTASITNSTDTARAATTFRCADAFSTATNRANAYFEYSLSETTGNALDSSSANNPGLYQGTRSTDTATPTACRNDTPKVGYAPNGAASTPQYLTTTNPVGTSPATFSLVVWFKTSIKGGRIIGLGASQTGLNSTYDRHIYLQPSGQLAFGTHSGTTFQIVTSPSGTNYADGIWHQVVATFTAGATNTGMYLYVDGALSASNASYTTAQADTGYWRIGYDSLSSAWTGSLSTQYFVGSIKFAAAYKYVMALPEIRAQYTIGLPG